MLYADDVGIVSRSPGGLQGTMTVIVTACSAFGLTVSEAKTEIVSFAVTAVGQVTNDRDCVLGPGLSACVTNSVAGSCGV